MQKTEPQFSALVTCSLVDRSVTPQRALADPEWIPVSSPPSIPCSRPFESVVRSSCLLQLAVQSFPQVALPNWLHTRLAIPFELDRDLHTTPRFLPPIPPARSLQVPFCARQRAPQTPTARRAHRVRSPRTDTAPPTLSTLISRPTDRSTRTLHLSRRPPPQQKQQQASPRVSWRVRRRPTSRTALPESRPPPVHHHGRD